MEQINNPIGNRVTAFSISYKTSSCSPVAKKKSLHLHLWTRCEDSLTARHCIYPGIFGVLSGRSKRSRLEYILLPMVQIYAGEEFLPPHEDEQCFWKGCRKKNTALMWSLQQPVKESISKTAQRYGRQRLKKWEYEATLEELGLLQNHNVKLQLEGLSWSLESSICPSSIVTGKGS